jgi:1-acyl-sn-glycerol-3-phosphate acyltransferase
MAAEAVSEKDSFLYKLAWILTWVVLHVFMPVRYHGKEKLSEREIPFVVISNHLHALDPLILAYPIKKCQCVFLGKKELAKNRFFRYCLTKVHCILVDRHHSDMEAMRACMKAIRMNKCLIIFPEGTRHHEGQMEHIETGTSLIVMRSRVPLVPVYLDRPLKLFRSVNAYIEDPIPYDDLLEKGVNKDTCEELNRRITETYQRIIEEKEKNQKKI